MLIVINEVYSLYRSFVKKSSFLELLKIFFLVIVKYEDIIRKRGIFFILIDIVSYN